MNEQEIIDLFQNIWRKRHIDDKLTFLGVQTCKFPTDLWIYQEIIYELKPEIIVESGTYKGGTSLYLATLLDIIGKGQVITIDIQKRTVPYHKRIVYLTGSSIEEKTVNEVKKRIAYKQPVMVILDSNHLKEHVLKEMEIYSKFVTIGSYLIVEDSDLNGHPSDFPTWKIGTPGPHEAIEEFLTKNKDFKIDKQREKFLLTVARDGYLKRIK